jgi:DNA-binding response OmpR family regulator
LRGRLVGCSDYITKPFEADALTVKVAKYLAPAVASSL